MSRKYANDLTIFLHLRIDEETSNKIEHYAKIKGQTKSEFIRELIENYRDKEDK